MHLATSTPIRASSRPSRAVDLAVGARAMAPWLAGIVPFGLVIGIATADANFPAFAGWLTGPLIYGGSAQVAVIDLLDAGATPALIIVAAVAVNLRLVLYSATMAKHWEGTPRWWRALAAYLVVDPSVAVGVDLYETATDRRRAHVQYMGAAGLLWFAWIGAITVGATAGARLPAALHFELVIPLFLAGTVAVRVSDSAARTAATTAAVVAVVALPVPLHLSPLIAIAAGLGAGLHVTRGERAVR